MADSDRSTVGRATWFNRFPVSTLLGLQYGAFAILPLFLHPEVPYRPLLLRIVALGLLGAIVAECFLFPTHPKGGKVRTQASEWVTPRTSGFVLAVGLVGLLLRKPLGISSYAVQLGLARRSPFAPLLTPFTAWPVIGLAMFLFCFAAGRLSRRGLAIAVAVALGFELVYAVQGGITASFFNYALVALMGLILVGAVRPRALLVAGVIGVLVWPTIYQLRNDARYNAGTRGTYGTEIDAQKRLREDLLLSEVGKFSGPLQIGQPSLLDVARYGLVPSFIDRHRPDLATGRKLSIALGRQEFTSSTTTFFGNVYLLGGGAYALMLVPAFLAVVCSLVARTITATRLVILLSVTSAMLYIESSWPDGLAGPMQALVAMFFAFAAVRFLVIIGRTFQHRRGSRASSITPAQAALRQLETAQFSSRSRCGGA